MRNSTVTSLLEQLRRETQRQKDNGELKDSEYREILEKIGEIEWAFSGG
jgi:hypothetical protein